MMAMAPTSDGMHGMLARARRFVSGYRAAVLALAMTLVAGACGDNAFDPGEETGEVRVSVSGLAAGATSAGIVTISGEAVGTVNVPLTSAVSVEEVPVGTYHVVYTPPAGYAMAAGEENEFDVTVTLDQTTEIALSVVAAEGSLTITTSGFGAGATLGGSALVLRTDVGGQTPNTVNLAANGSTEISLVPGTYQVTYTSPAGYQLAGGQTNPQTVQVTAGGDAVATFGVQPAPQADPGTLRITTSGFPGGTSNVGSVSVLRTDVSGQTPQNVSLEADGSTDLTLAAGAYRVTYSAPSGYRLVDGQTNPRNVTVNSGSTVTQSFTVEAYTAPGGVVFHSDFGTALGTSDAALRDTGKQVPWSDIIGNGRASEVVSSAGLDFPTANVLRVVGNGSEGGVAASQTLRLLNQVPVPGVGESIYYRWYFRLTIPNSFTGDNNTHPIQDAGPSDQNWLLRLANRSDGTYNAQFRVGAGPWEYSQFGTNLALQKNVTYRFEMQIHRISTSAFNMHARIYGSDGTLLYDDDDFRNPNGSASLANNPEIPFVNVSFLHGMTAGFNGLGSGTGYPVTLYYQGGFCIRTDSWCGAYSGGI